MHVRAELEREHDAADAGGTRGWQPIAKTTKCSDAFTRLGPGLEEEGFVRHGRVGDAIVMTMRSRDVVRFAVEVLSARPDALLCDDPTCVPDERRVLAEWSRSRQRELLP